MFQFSELLEFVSQIASIPLAEMRLLWVQKTVSKIGKYIELLSKNNMAGFGFLLVQESFDRFIRMKLIDRAHDIMKHSSSNFTDGISRYVNEPDQS